MCLLWYTLSRLPTQTPEPQDSAGLFSYLGFYFEPRHAEETDVCLVGGGGEERTIAPNTPQSVSNLGEQTS